MNDSLEAYLDAAWRDVDEALYAIVRARFPDTPADRFVAAVSGAATRAAKEVVEAAVFAHQAGQR